MPLNETYLNDVLQELENRGIRMTRSEVDSMLGQMVERGELIKDDTSFVTVYRPAK